MEFHEVLPDDCPPKAAKEVSASREVFRLVRASPPTMNDFRSYQAEYPSNKYKNECQARGLSVHERKADSENLLKLPSMHGRLICRVTLGVGAGHIQQTSKPSHHTWWPFKSFDILGNCKVESV